MTTSYHYFTGKCQWAKVSAPGDQTHEKYSIDIFLDKDQLKKFNALKLRVKLKMTEEGQPYVTLSRKFSKNIKDETIQFGEPMLYDKDDKIIEGDRPLIGNGSQVAVKISVYETAYEGVKMNGHRLEAVKIIDLIKYEAKPLGMNPVDGVPF